MLSNAGLASAELVFAFGPYRLVPGRQLLLAGERRVRLGGRAFELLHLLVQRSGQLVTKRELIAAAWPETFVHEDNLKVNMSNLRRLLGDAAAAPSYLTTVPGRGYIFTAAVQTLIAPLAEPAQDDEPSGPIGLPDAPHMVGRQDEVARVVDALDLARHVTIVGAGGIGKTTVAIAAAHAYAQRCPDGACFIDLAAIEDPTLLPVALVTALGIRGSPGSGFDTILAFLRTRQMLLLLDNCEHVLSAATLFADRLASQQGRSKVLATSREPLGLEAEVLLRVGALAAPDANAGLGAADALAFPAVELFAQRASEWSDYALAGDDWAAVAAICRSVEGLPLAIELTAAQLGDEGPTALLARLDHQLGFAHPRRASASARHETMLATIAWSYRRLAPRDAALLRAVSVFSDDFEPEDAIHVAAAAGLDPTTVMSSLGALASKSLISARVSGPNLRYRLLDSIRRYAVERRREDPIDGALRRRHAERILELFRRSEHEWNWLETGDWIARYVSRLSDLRAALGWAFGDGGDPLIGIELTGAAIALWSETSILSEAQGRVEQALALATSVPCSDLLRAKLACSLGWSLFYANKASDENETAFLDALAFARRANNLEYEQRALVGLAFYLLQVGRITEAIGHLEASGALSEQYHDWTHAPEGERALAWARAHRGEFVESGKVLDRLAAQYARPTGASQMARQDVFRFVTIRCYQPFVAWITGHAGRAASAAREAVELAGEAGHWVSQANALGLAALPLALEMGDAAALRRYSAMLKENLEREAIPRWLPVHRYFSAVLRDLDGDREAWRDADEAVDELVRCRYLLRAPMYLGGVARLLVQKDLLEEASLRLSGALRLQEAQGELWCRPELRRIGASIRSRAGDAAQAEEALRQALADAQMLGTRPFELRIATDLATHWLRSGRQADAWDLLRDVREKVVGGGTTRDVLVAAEVLERASAS